jgi:hypothetical protein
MREKYLLKINAKADFPKERVCDTISLFELTSVTLRKPEKSATTFPCVSMTPFGFPTEEGFRKNSMDFSPYTCSQQWIALALSQMVHYSLYSALLVKSSALYREKGAAYSINPWKTTKVDIH